VAQLHFFYMARLFGFLDYAAQHLEEILPHMKEVISETKDVKEQAKKEGIAYRRKPLVAKARPKAFIAEGRFTLYFGLHETAELPPGETATEERDGEAEENGEEEEEEEEEDEEGEEEEDDLDDTDDNGQPLSADMKDSLACLFG
jgi:hypothetical protein